ncbi:MAG: prepilin-type N-terminal cleavage/methylation domain-containing protein [Planctomycetaceae bacterium]|nr:prepilin-type N-terminal cleavage/methylation domain-containing protein [Planctomycetaceae bacterium]
MCSFRQRHPGFTLLELVIVLTILVVVAAAITPGILRMMTRNNVNNAAKELQAELYKTRLKAIQSGEPLAFRFQPGTGEYEVIAKSEYDQLFPPVKKPAVPLNETIGSHANDTTWNNMTSFDENLPGDGMTASGNGEESDPVAIHSAVPTAGSLSQAPSAADLFAGSSQPPTAGGLGTPATAGELGDPPTLGGLFAEPSSDTQQQIAALPVSKVVPERKTLPNELVFGTISNAVPTVFFFPNGRASDSQFFLQTPKSSSISYRIEISMRGLTGTAKLGSLEPGGQ